MQNQPALLSLQTIPNICYHKVNARVVEDPTLLLPSRSALSQGPTPPHSAS